MEKVAWTVLKRDGGKQHGGIELRQVKAGMGHSRHLGVGGRSAEGRQLGERSEGKRGGGECYAGKAKKIEKSLAAYHSLDCTDERDREPRCSRESETRRGSKKRARKKVDEAGCWRRRRHKSLVNGY